MYSSKLHQKQENNPRNRYNSSQPAAKMFRLITNLRRAQHHGIELPMLRIILRLIWLIPIQGAAIHNAKTRRIALTLVGRKNQGRIIFGARVQQQW